MHRTFVCLVLFLFFAAPLWALQPEEGPGFLTDSHGAMAVIEVLLELGDDFPDGEVLLTKTLQWYDDVKIDRGGAYSWMRSTSAPEGHMAHVEDYRISAKLIEKCAAVQKQQELNLGFCGGLGGTHIFLLDLADAIESTQPELAERCRRNCDVIGGWFVNRSIQLNNGIAWHGREKEGGDKVVSLAIDYGLTGMVIGLHKLAVERPKPDYEKAWRGATRGLLSLGVTEGAGLKWPWYTRSEEPYR